VEEEVEKEISCFMAGVIAGKPDNNNDDK